MAPYLHCDPKIAQPREGASAQMGKAPDLAPHLHCGPGIAQPREGAAAQVGKAPDLAPHLHCGPFTGPHDHRHSSHRRFRDYDYSRGGALFATIGLSPRKPLFGRVDHDRIILAPAGQAAIRRIREAENRFAGSIRLHRFVIMPTHLHLRFSWPAGLADPLRTIGAFVGWIKQTIHWDVAGHSPSIWEKGWHDLVCTSARMNRCVDAYIGYNPLKHWLMHQDRSLLHVHEPFLLPAGDHGSVWRAVGDTALLGAERLVAVRISRRIPREALPGVVEVFLRAAEKGHRIVSTFYSPGEKMLLEALAARPQSPMVRLVPTFVSLAYRPHGLETPLFAAHRLLVLSRMADPEAQPTRPELLDLNTIAEALALSSPDGMAVYAQWTNNKVVYQDRAARDRAAP